MSTRGKDNARKGSGKDRKGGSASRARASAGRDRDDDASGSDDERTNGVAGGRGGNTAAPPNDAMPLIMFDQSKNELKQLNAGFKQLQNKLRQQYRFVASVQRQPAPGVGGATDWHADQSFPVRIIEP